MEDFILLVALILLAVILMYVIENLRPLILALLLAYLAFPIYWFIASLDIDPLARIFLQILTFMAMYGAVLYMVVSYLYRMRMRTYAAKK